MSAGRNNKARGLISLLKGITLDLCASVEVEHKEIPVSKELYLELSYEFTTDEDERKTNTELLTRLRDGIIARLRERGWGPSTDAYFSKNPNCLESTQDGWISVIEVEDVYANHHTPFMRLSPRSYLKR